MIYVGKESERQWRWLIHFAVQQKVRHHCKPTINHFFFFKDRILLRRCTYAQGAHTGDVPPVSGEQLGYLTSV